MEPFSNPAVSQAQFSAQINQDFNHVAHKSQNFIAGVWRGFHETEKLTVYYGYQFRLDGTFWARHRIYEERQTVENKIWEGKWKLEGNILTITGINKDAPNELLTIRFQLSEGFKLNYQEGSLSDVYKSMTLNKINSIN
ncbi:MAG: hypothetical protein AAGF26_06450 [Cyanobacteria bacterium P01_G01_bin.49]